MTTILIWLGSGFAFGVGCIVGAWLMMVKNTRTESAYEKMFAQQEVAGELLSVRNEIGLRELRALERIADSLAERNKPNNPPQPI